MGRTVKKINLEKNEIGIDGVRRMVPFLNNARNLISVDMDGNENIDTECFRLIVQALHAAGGSIKELILNNCNIDDITALDHCSLPSLKHLDLDFNNIQSIPSSLDNYINLDTLSLDGNKIGREGCRKLSKLLNDTSSIDRTYNSNHCLTALYLPRSTDATIQELTKHIKTAIKINESNEGNSHAAGRAKVIETQLNSMKRKELSQLQGVNYSYESIFAEIEPILLPEILALVGEEHGQNEMYQMLLATAPDLASVVNRKGLLKQTIAKNVAIIADLEAKTAALAARNLQMNNDLASMESEEKNQGDIIGRKTTQTFEGEMAE